MISDVLSDAVAKMSDYQAAMPEVYGDIKLELDSLKESITAMRIKLDTPPDEHRAAHTPGPWMLDYNEGSSWSIGAFTMRPLAKVLIPNNQRETAKANARLIEAAPDLLEALKALQDCVIGMDQSTLDESFVSARDMATAAIAKAER